MQDRNRTRREMNIGNFETVIAVTVGTQFSIIYKSPSFRASTNRRIDFHDRG